MSSVKNSSILEIPQFFFGLVVVAMVILIIFVIGGLAEWTWVWLAASTSDYRGAIKANCSITLSHHNCTEWLVKNEAVNAPIIFEEFVLVMIKVWTALIR